tara:strand:- start:314 stop:490 length:177 start_codon:yes stop_codon:yes gene_type:complete
MSNTPWTENVGYFTLFHLWQNQIKALNFIVVANDEQLRRRMSVRHQFLGIGDQFIVGR